MELRSFTTFFFHNDVQFYYSRNDIYKEKIVHSLAYAKECIWWRGVRCEIYRYEKNSAATHFDGLLMFLWGDRQVCCVILDGGVVVLFLCAWGDVMNECVM